MRRSSGIYVTRLPDEVELSRNIERVLATNSDPETVIEAVDRIAAAV